MNLRNEIIAALSNVYFSKERKGTLMEDMADAVLAVVKRK
jgi:hypothetical protein